MRNWDFKVYQQEIKTRTKNLRAPKLPDRDVRDRDPYESEALARKVKEAWQRDLDRGVLVKIPGGYKFVWQKTRA
ncbi:MAG TPA: hypothetical protein DEP57_09710 [Selenomonas sp.]|nr:hypothetical protein [Selenomonas sp.]